MALSKGTLKKIYASAAVVVIAGGALYFGRNSNDNTSTELDNILPSDSIPALVTESGETISLDTSKSPLEVISAFYDSYNLADGDAGNGVAVIDGAMSYMDAVATTDLQKPLNDLAQVFGQTEIDQREIRCAAEQQLQNFKNVGRSELHASYDTGLKEAKALYALSKKPRPKNMEKYSDYYSSDDRGYITISPEYADQSKADIFREYPELASLIPVFEDGHLTMQEVVEAGAKAVKSLAMRDGDSEIARIYKGFEKFKAVQSLSEYTKTGTTVRAFMEKYGIDQDNKDAYNALLLIEAVQYAPDDQVKGGINAVLSLFQSLSLDAQRDSDCDCAVFEEEQRKMAEERFKSAVEDADGLVPSAEGSAKYPSGEMPLPEAF